MNNPDEPNDGGPAFPRPYSMVLGTGHQFWEQDGMTLRDWFAGQALASVTYTLGAEIDDSVAKRCYEIADAMIAAREGQPK